MLLRRQMEEQQKVLAFSETVLRERIREACARRTHRHAHSLFWTLTLEMAIAYRRAYIEWCEKSMELLEESFLDEGPSHVAEHTHTHVRHAATASATPADGRPDRCQRRRTASAMMRLPGPRALRPGGPSPPHAEC